VAVVGVYSPGAMGSTLAYSCSVNGHKTIWASEGRSEKTVIRAKKFGIEDVVSLENLLGKSDFIFSIASNFDAFEFARVIASMSFKGIYVDFNTMYTDTDGTEIENILTPNNIKYVEGALRGWPVKEPGEEITSEKTMYLSGLHANTVKELFGNFWRIRTMPKSAKLLNRVLAEELAIIYGQG
jgi:3-hydroxyisobutyrate dehydrogenase-like beta-hydroxyacid dehydrogenase